jgi:hypothetical protein
VDEHGLSRGAQVVEKGGDDAELGLIWNSIGVPEAEMQVEDGFGNVAPRWRLRRRRSCLPLPQGGGDLPEQPRHLVWSDHHRRLSTCDSLARHLSRPPHR